MRGRVVAELRQLLVQFGELFLLIHCVFAAFQKFVHFLQAFPASGFPILCQRFESLHPLGELRDLAGKFHAVVFGGEETGDLRFETFGLFDEFSRLRFVRAMAVSHFFAVASQSLEGCRSMFLRQFLIAQRTLHPISGFECIDSRFEFVHLIFQRVVLCL